MSASFRLSIKHRRALRGIFDEAGINHDVDDSIAILAGAADCCWRALQREGTPAIVEANWSIALLRGLERVWEERQGCSGGCEDLEVQYIEPYEKIQDRAVRDMWHSKKKNNKAIRKLAEDVSTEWCRVTCLALPRPEPSGKEYWDATNQSPNLLWLMLDAVGINVGWRAVYLLVSCSQYKSIEEALR